VVSFTPQPLYFREKELTVHTEKEAAWAPESVFRFYRSEVVSCRELNTGYFSSKISK
jgi:hypothetical protein